jgi:hypothetical protein
MTIRTLFRVRDVRDERSLVNCASAFQAFHHEQSFPSSVLQQIPDWIQRGNLYVIVLHHVSSPASKPQ